MPHLETPQPPLLPSLVCTYHIKNLLPYILCIIIPYILSLIFTYKQYLAHQIKQLHNYKFSLIFWSIRTSLKSSFWFFIIVFVSETIWFVNKFQGNSGFIVLNWLFDLVSKIELQKLRGILNLFSWNFVLYFFSCLAQEWLKGIRRLLVNLHPNI